MFLSDIQKRKITYALMDSEDPSISSIIRTKHSFVRVRIKKEQREEIRLHCCKDFQEVVLNIPDFYIIIDSKHSIFIGTDHSRAIYVYPGDYEFAKKYTRIGHKKICNNEFIIKTWNGLEGLEVLPSYQKNKLNLE